MKTPSPSTTHCARNEHQTLCGHEVATGTRIVGGGLL